MSSLMILRRIQVENANAIAGHTYGFPAISHFLGFTHALSRQLQASHGLRLEGCGVVCHQHQVHAYGSGWNRSFALTRNPLTKEEKTAAFNEEGRMHLTVSLLIECHGMLPGEDGREALRQQVRQQAQQQRLAGGLMVDIEQVSFHDIPARGADTRSLMRRLLPGFVLLDCTSLLPSHLETLQQTKPQADMLDAWLDFAALKYQAVRSSDDAVSWQPLPKPDRGYLVPLMTGYRAISPLYNPGEVEKTRDPSTPFCFAEAIYGVGEWRGAHRIDDINHIFWRYHYQHGTYRCLQTVNDAGSAADDDYPELEFNY
ncbi:type I-F CRISPR-associated protein Csy2 [Dickeya chrysanthemi]|uniref:type I-F CRISPR-associated protein Csy2 n=1 Tax=Dickeya chrysanthemi TaxID=556 RepID=UPI001CF2FBAB|nr:type I-F CRISPR-associated protein Csy2 [Dickeya chrysanthemi]MCA7006701.1 type I-F CRISPR-associated protein Csy2 [Dickeya chrysanthemi]